MNGVYETLRTFSGIFALISEHQKRLNNSCKKIGIKAPNLKELLRIYENKKEVRIKINVFSDKNEIFNEEIPAWNGNFLYNAIWNVKPVLFERENPEIKGIKNLKFEEEMKNAKIEGYDEILLIDREGKITEGGVTNVFFIKDQKLITPRSNILPGIARDLVISAAKFLQIAVEERDVLKDEKFEACFLTNSIRGVVPVKKINPMEQKIVDVCSKFINKKINEEKN